MARLALLVGPLLAVAGQGGACAGMGPAPEGLRGLRRSRADCEWSVLEALQRIRDFLPN